MTRTVEAYQRQIRLRGNTQTKLGRLSIMTMDQTLKVDKKISGKIRKTARSSDLAPAPSSPPIPVPKDAQAYGAFLAFLGLIARTAATDSSAPDDMDPNETALLEIVILRWSLGTPMTVRQTIAMAQLGSPATLHKRLMRLRAKGYLQLQDVAGDRRVKQLVAGARGVEYIETMGRHLLKAKRNPAARSTASTE